MNFSVTRRTVCIWRSLFSSRPPYCRHEKTTGAIRSLSGGRDVAHYHSQRHRTLWLATLAAATATPVAEATHVGCGITCYNFVRMLTGATAITFFAWSAKAVHGALSALLLRKHRVRHLPLCVYADWRDVVLADITPSLTSGLLYGMGGSASY